MSSRRKTFLVSLVALACAFMAVAAATQKQSTDKGKQKLIDESRFPIVDYTAAEQMDERERVKKEAKEKKYGKYKETIGPGVTHAFLVHHWPEGFPGLPVTQSDAVVIGEVSDVKAHLTSDKTSVYSSFNVRLIEVLKSDNGSLSSPDASIITERPGGRVRYPSGHVSLFTLTGLGMPQTGRRYVLFLTREEQEESYQILTGYELLEGRVSPLDGEKNSSLPFASYKGVDEAIFLNQLRGAIKTAHE